MGTTKANPESMPGMQVQEVEQVGSVLSSVRKVCTRCKIEKTPTDFSRRRNYCKSCQVIDRRARYLKRNKDIDNAKARQYRKRNLDRLKARDTEYRKKYREREKFLRIKRLTESPELAEHYKNTRRRWVEKNRERHRDHVRRSREKGISEVSRWYASVCLRLPPNQIPDNLLGAYRSLAKLKRLIKEMDRNQKKP